MNNAICDILSPCSSSLSALGLQLRLLLTPTLRARTLLPQARLGRPARAARATRGGRGRGSSPAVVIAPAGPGFRHLHRDACRAVGVLRRIHFPKFGAGTRHVAGTRPEVLGEGFTKAFPEAVNGENETWKSWSIFSIAVLTYSNFLLK